jgi:endo-1,4-beta-xylanase
MKWEAIEPQPGKFDFSRPDKLVELALQHGMKVRGHTLCWHSQLAGWVYDLKTRDEMIEALKNHIKTVVGHYKGKVYEWDVANEMIDAGQDDGLCRDIFYNVFGPDYLDSCFVWAHEADPDARLVMNDFLVEIDGDGKAMKFLEVAVAMKRRGIPIDGVGFQCHCYWLGCFASQKQKMKTLLKRYARYGLDVSFTEMDQGLAYNDRDKLSAWEAQANDYRTLMEVAVEAPNVHSLIVWGMSDPYSWRPSFDGAIQPLILGDYLQAKPAYTAMYEVLKKAAESNSIESVNERSGQLACDKWHTFTYNLAGLLVDANFKGIVIKNGKKYLQR